MRKSSVYFSLGAMGRSGPICLRREGFTPGLRNLSLSGGLDAKRTGKKREIKVDRKYTILYKILEIKVGENYYGKPEKKTEYLRKNY